jgi:hypothetical protein
MATNNQDVGTYLMFTLDTPEDKAAAVYANRYGRAPAVARRWIITHWPGDEPWGYTIAGPIPEKDDN